MLALDADRGMAAAALAYAGRGWPVFPCDPSSKRPLLRNAPGEDGRGGVKKASTDPGQVADWWGQSPRAMVGVATGESIGAFVLDLDAGTDTESGVVYVAEDLRASVEAAIGCALPATWIARTPRGGWHMYFALPAGEPMPGNRAGLIHRVDVRGNGGYVILPPSVRADGVAYEWIERPSRTEIAPAPPALLDCILRRGRWARSPAAGPDGPAAPEKRTSGVPGASAPASDPVRRYALAALDAELRACEAAVEGTRSDQLNRSAFALGQLVGADALSEATVRAGLEGVARRWPNLPKSRSTIASGLRAGMAAPRDLREPAARASERVARHGFSAAPAPEPDDYGCAPLAPGSGDDGQTFIGDLPIDEAPSDAPDAAIPPEKLQACAVLDSSDTDNGKRLIAYFGHDLWIMEESGSAGGVPLTWSGRHWDIDGGAAGAFKLAQRVGGVIAQESDFLVASPAEQEAIEGAAAAVPELNALLAGGKQNDAQKARARELKGVIAAGEAASSALVKRRHDRRRAGVTAKNKGRVDAMLACAAPHLRRPPDDFNCDSLKVATLTHTLTFTQVVDPENPDPDGERKIWMLRAVAGHNRDDLITGLVPVRYDPDAKSAKWDAFLDRFMPKAGKRRTLQQYCGLGLLGIVVQHLMFHYGEGANGKSVFLETIMRVLGDSVAVSLPPETLIGTGDRNAGSASPDLMRLYGKRTLRVPEVKQDAPLQEDLVKRITGGERMTARTLFKGYVDFQNVAKPHMSGNGFPRINGTDHGIRRRLLVMHWEVTIAREDQKEFEEVVRDLQTEAPAILNWLLAGALDYLNAGFYIDAEVTRSTENYLNEMDVIGQFHRACVCEAPGERVQARHMFEAFERWCAANAKHPVQETRFGRRMKKLAPYDDKGPRHMYMDVRLESVPDGTGNNAAPLSPPLDEEYVPWGV